MFRGHVGVTKQTKSIGIYLIQFYCILYIPLD